jgi:hypothetical protein
MTPELTKAVNELAITLLGLITTVFIPWLFALVRAYAKAKIDSIQNAEVRKSMEFALQRLDATAETVVAELNQTVKELAADGSISAEDGKLLLRKAYNRLSSRLPADATATLQSAYGDKLQAVMVGKIESKVAAAKLAQCAGNSQSAA